MAANSTPPSWYKPGQTPIKRWYGVYTALDFGKLGSNKEILIEVFESATGGRLAMRTQFGKTGTIESGKAQTDWQYEPRSETMYNAVDAFEAKVKDKTNPRRDTPYTEIKLADQSAVKITAPNKPAKVRKATTEVDIFKAAILAEAGRQIKAVLLGSTGLNDLAPEQVNAAKVVLADLGPIVERYEASHAASLKADIIRYSNKYFSLIPHQTGTGHLQIPHSIRDPFAAAVTTAQRISDEYDFLDTLSAAVANKAAFQQPDDAADLDLGAEIELASDAETKRIHKLMTSNLGNHRQYGRPGKVFAVRNPGVHSAYESYGLKIGGERELFHGSRAANWHGILSQGIRIKPKGVPHAGSMFGNGAYFADNPMKSYLYTDVGRNGTRYMAVCAVALGRIMRHEYSHHYNAAPKGYDSVMGAAGGGLAHNEYIVYDTRQHDLRFIVEFN